MVMSLLMVKAMLTDACGGGGEGSGSCNDDVIVDGNFCDDGRGYTSSCWSILKSTKDFLFCTSSGPGPGYNMLRGDDNGDDRGGEGSGKGSPGPGGGPGGGGKVRDGDLNDEELRAIYSFYLFPVDMVSDIRVKHVFFVGP